MDETELTELMRRLSPAAVNVDVVSAALEAGRKQGRREIRLWRGITVGCLLLSAVMWSRALPPAAPVKNSPAPLLAEQPAPPAPPLSEESALRLQAAVLEHGLDGLPHVEPASSGAAIHGGDLL